MKRTAFLRTLGLSLGFFSSLNLKGLIKDTGYCYTQSDALGPYFRENAPRTDRLWRTKLTGTRLTISGAVMDGANCEQVLPGALIEVWHADPMGHYDNDTDDYNFRAKLQTDQYGQYTFRTLMPGKYGSRPRHIHYKVSCPGYQTLITQLYFKEDESADYLSRKADRHRKITLDKGPLNAYGSFKIYLRKSD